MASEVTVAMAASSTQKRRKIQMTSASKDKGPFMVHLKFTDGSVGAYLQVDSIN